MIQTQSRKKLKVMIFIDWFYPAFKAGGQVQSCMNIIESLAGKFDFYVVSSDRDLGDTHPFEHQLLNSWVPYKTNGSVYYIGQQKYSAKLVRDLISEISPDVIYLNSMYSWKYTVVPLREARKKSIKIILAPSGMLQQGAMHTRKTKKILFLSVARAFGLFRGVRFHATDNVESEDVRMRISPATEIVELPCLPPQGGSTLVQVEKKAGELKLIYFSRITEKKNLLFLLQLLESIEEPVSLDVYGDSDDDDYYAECIVMKGKLDKHCVRFMGAANNNRLEEIYSNYHVFILPTRGENFGYAILEALVFGRPVIISDRTPWRELNRQNVGYDIPLDNKEVFLQAISHFLKMDQEAYGTWSASAWRYAKSIQQEQSLRTGYEKLFSI